MELKAGTLLQGGRYCILQTLGQGGFGITYLAEQIMARRKVCIKEFFPKEYYNRDLDSCNISLGSHSNAEFMGKFKSKFIKEAQTIATLDHPHVVHIFDVFEENNTSYYVMEYIEGMSLNDMVKSRGALSEIEAVKYITEVASALKYIHDRKINHLDVKPGNIMVQAQSDSAILIDFGLSKHYDDDGAQTSSTPVGISHGFAPIEQYKAGGVSIFSPATDIYSLGATLYYLVTGKVPPQATDVGEEGLPTLPNHLSMSMHRTIELSMNYWRKQRLQSIDAFMNILGHEVTDLGYESNDIEIKIADEDERTAIVNTKSETTKIKADSQPSSSVSHNRSRNDIGFLGMIIVAIITIIFVALIFVVLSIFFEFI